jgi:hypothetical protein
LTCFSEAATIVGSARPVLSFNLYSKFWWI